MKEEFIAFWFLKLAIFGHKFIEKFIFNKGLHKKKYPLKILTTLHYIIRCKIELRLKNIARVVFFSLLLNKNGL